MHNFHVPEDARLENLLEQVFEQQYQPDQAQLTRIHDRLLHTIKRQKPEKKPNKIPWWIVLLLVGGFASASWWAGKNVFNERIDKSDPVEPEQRYKSGGLEYKGQMNKQERQESDEITHDRDMNIIYQRESF
jgi:hypothetical protein